MPKFQCQQCFKFVTSNEIIPDLENKIAFVDTLSQQTGAIGYNYKHKGCGGNVTIIKE